MPQENLDLVRSIVALGGWRLQLGRVGASRDRVRDRRWADTRQLDGTGRDGPELARLPEDLGGVPREADEYRELDGERVLVLNRFSGRGKTSGLEVGQMRAKGASLFQIRSGKVTRLVLYFKRERALKDAGLSE